MTDTTDQPEPLTLQSFFDNMIEGLEKQQYHASYHNGSCVYVSLDGIAYHDGSCVYVSSDSIGCAVGVCLNDTEKAWLMETQNGFYNRQSFRKVMDVAKDGAAFDRWKDLYDNGVSLEAITQAQTNHDTHLRDKKVSYWFVATLELMHKYKLNTDKLVAAMDRYVAANKENYYTRMFYREHAKHKMNEE